MRNIFRLEKSKTCPHSAYRPVNGTCTCKVRWSVKAERARAMTSLIMASICPNLPIEAFLTLFNINDIFSASSPLYFSSLFCVSVLSTRKTVPDRGYWRVCVYTDRHRYTPIVKRKRERGKHTEKEIEISREDFGISPIDGEFQSTGRRLYLWTLDVLCRIFMCSIFPTHFIFMNNKKEDEGK